ncbi:hypothetical protein, partial [Ureaplasma zalophigenitalium]
GIPKLMNNVMQNIKIWLPETTDEIKNLSNLLKRWSVAISLLQRKRNIIKLIFKKLCNLLLN